MDNLLDRVRKYHDAIRTGDPDRQMRDGADLELFDEIIEALTPILPEDVQAVIEILSEGRIEDYEQLAIDALQRLAQENANRRISNEIAIKRIAELEGQLNER